MVDYRDPAALSPFQDAGNTIGVREAGGRVRTVFWWMIASLIVSVLVGFAAFVIGVLLATPGSGGTGSGVMLSTTQAIGSMLTTGMMVAVAIAWWKATVPIAGVDPERDAPRARQGVRIGNLAMIVLSIASGIHSATTPTPSFAPSQTMHWSQLFPPTMIAIVLISFIVTGVYYAAAAYYLRWLLRTPSHPEPSGLADACVWLIPLLATVGIIICIGPLAAYALMFVLLYSVSTALMNTAPDDDRAHSSAAQA